VNLEILVRLGFTLVLVAAFAIYAHIEWKKPESMFYYIAGVLSIAAFVFIWAVEW